jgi:hypothetical protein
MAKINQNTLAKEISQQEGGLDELNIGQIKEVLRITLELLAEKKPSEVLALLESKGVTNG